MPNKTFKISRPSIFLCSFLFSPVFVGAMLGLYLIFKEGRHIYLNDQLTMLLMIFLLLFILHGIAYAVIFKVEVDESSISITNPYVFWQSEKLRILKWDEIVKVERGYSLLAQTKPLILKSKMDVKKIAISPVVNGFSELVEIIFGKVSSKIDSDVRLAIEAQIRQGNKKWPLSIGWTIVFAIIVAVAAVHLMMGFLMWPNQI